MGQGIFYESFKLLNALIKVKFINCLFDVMSHAGSQVSQHCEPSESETEPETGEAHCIQRHSGNGDLI